MNKAVFLDRDGTLVEDVGYASAPDQMHLLPGAAEAVAEFRRRGYLVVLITNQSGIGRELFTEADVAAMHEKIQADLAAAGGALDAIYYCPHMPSDAAACKCRKPLPGMILQAAKEHDIELSQSIMVGDKPSDVEAGRAAGCRVGLVATGPAAECAPDFVVRSLCEVIPHLDGET